MQPIVEMRTGGPARVAGTGGPKRIGHIPCIFVDNYGPVWGALVNDLVIRSALKTTGACSQQAIRVLSGPKSDPPFQTETSCNSECDDNSCRFAMNNLLELLRSLLCCRARDAVSFLSFERDASAAAAVATSLREQVCCRHPIEAFGIAR